MGCHLAVLAVVSFNLTTMPVTGELGENPISWAEAYRQRSFRAPTCASSVYALLPHPACISIAIEIASVSMRPDAAAELSCTTKTSVQGPKHVGVK